MSNDGASFDGLDLRTNYGGSADLLERFYVPVLQRAVRYDRVAGYFASSAFVSAAAGVARFIANGGTMRLLVGAQLNAADRDALSGEAELGGVVARRLLAGVDLDADAVARHRYQVMAWLVSQERLQIRVGIPCDDDGLPLTADHPRAGSYFHPKWGILGDARGARIVFNGSINESATGWESNYETFDVYTSARSAWADHGQPRVEQFEQLWGGEAEEGWTSISLPEAVRQRLIDLLPPEAGWVPPERDPLEADEAGSKQDCERQVCERVEAIRGAPLTGTGVGLVSAGVAPWPHQIAIARRICETWPRSYLLADEVGLGKTIEAGLVLRELLLSGRVSTALLLVPASLLIQWQEELNEKFLLDVPRLDPTRRRLVFTHGRVQAIEAAQNHWRAAPVLLASSHLARRRQQRQLLLEGDGWDLVLVDEAHHARTQGPTTGDAPNQMLATLMQLKQAGMYTALLAASATPMQMHTSDLWSLLNLLGLPPLWDRGPYQLECYYSQLGEPFTDRDWVLLQRFLGAQIDHAEPDPAVTTQITDKLGWVASERIISFHETGLDRAGARQIPDDHHVHWDSWLRANTPVRDRVMRTTRSTLRSYAADGLLAADRTVPHRHVQDRFCSLGGARTLYERIERYIGENYDTYRQTGGRNSPLGFVMTVYRRRLTSSFYAVRCSLQRRLETLRDRRGRLEPFEDSLPGLLDRDDEHTLETSAGFDAYPVTDSGAGTGADGDFGTGAGTDSGDGPTRYAGLDLQGEIKVLEHFVSDLESRPPDEPKMALLHDLLSDVFAAGHPSAVVFTQYTDTLDYLREQLLPTYWTQILCYSGRGAQRWDPAANAWANIAKQEAKDLFRRGEARIMIGTDSMSEGLNLQTCDQLVNFDLPWNFTKVEQRIGRIDRIGGRPAVHVTNLFYQDTVEEDIYRRIKDRHDWFTQVVGKAQPVLSATESLIQKAAMGELSTDEVGAELSEILEQLEGSPIDPADLDSIPVHDRELAPAMDLRGLQEHLFSVPAIRERFVEHPDYQGAWLLSDGPGQCQDGTGSAPGRAGAARGVTFDPVTYQDHPGLCLLSWGNPLLERLLDQVSPPCTAG